MYLATICATTCVLVVRIAKIYYFSFNFLSFLGFELNSHKFDVFKVYNRKKPVHVKLLKTQLKKPSFAMVYAVMIYDFSSLGIRIFLDFEIS